MSLKLTKPYIKNPAWYHYLSKVMWAGFFIFETSCGLLWAGNENYLPGARSSALSNASVTLSDAWGTFYNQAGLANLESPTVAFHFENRFLVKEYALQAGTFAIPVKPGAFGLSYRYFGFSKYYEAKFGLAYAHKFSPYFSAGVQVDYLQTHIAEGFGNYNAITAELAILTEPVKNFKIGVHLFNPTRVKQSLPSEEKLPVIMRAGFGYTFEEKASVYFEAEKDVTYNPLYKGGLEIVAIGNLLFRGGFSSGYEQYSFGLGYKHKKIFADMAFTRHFYLGFTPHVSIGIEL